MGRGALQRARMLLAVLSILMAVVVAGKHRFDGKSGWKVHLQLSISKVGKTVAWVKA